MKYCPNCGNEREGSEPYCSLCGHYFEKEKSQYDKRDEQIAFLKNKVKELEQQLNNQKNTGFFPIKRINPRCSHYLLSYQSYLYSFF